MSRLNALVLAFMFFGWMLPRWALALCPILLGVLLVLVGIAALVGSSHDPSPTSGLGGVLAAFLGVCVALVGIGMTDYRDHAEAALGWFEALPDGQIVIGGVVVGLVIAIFMARNGR